jgi:hypothetical protein
MTPRLPNCEQRAAALPQALAAEYGVRQSTVWKILTDRS